jgi:hypothetical protein
MADQKPPRLAGDPRATLCALLGYQRASLLRKVEGLTDEQAAISPVPSGTSLLWLVEHMAGAERTWVVDRFAGLGADRPDGAGSDPTGRLADAVTAYRATTDAVDAIVAAAPGLDTRCVADVGEPPVDLGWVLAHLVEETARHAGHADILRELLDGATGR